MFAKIVNGTQDHMSTEIEETFSYIRSDGFKVLMTVCRVDDHEIVGGISAWTPDDCNRTGEPSQAVDLNIEELRYWRALLNRPEVAAMLEEICEPDEISVPVEQKPAQWA